MFFDYTCLYVTKTRAYITYELKKIDEKPHIKTTETTCEYWTWFEWIDMFVIYQRNVGMQCDVTNTKCKCILLFGENKLK